MVQHVIPGEFGGTRRKNIMLQYFSYVCHLLLELPSPNIT